VIISKFREQSSLHQQTLKRLRANEQDLHVFKTIIPERNSTADAVEYAPRQTFRQRYGYDGGYEVYDSLAKELRQLVGQTEAVATA
jgi:chromosome partitioning protein